MLVPMPPPQGTAVGAKASWTSNSVTTHLQMWAPVIAPSKAFYEYQMG